MEQQKILKFYGPYHLEIFDRSAMNSALRYRYVPQMEEGQPVEVSNVKTIVVFKIESPGKDMYYTPPGCD